MISKPHGLFPKGKVVRFFYSPKTRIIMKKLLLGIAAACLAGFTFAQAPLYLPAVSNLFLQFAEIFFLIFHCFLRKDMQQTIKNFHRRTHDARPRKPLERCTAQV